MLTEEGDKGTQTTVKITHPTTTTGEEETETETEDLFRSPAEKMSFQMTRSQSSTPSDTETTEMTATRSTTRRAEGPM